LKERRTLAGRAQPRRLAFVIPGDLSSRTGGYEYDRRIVEGLRRLGWSVDIVGLDDSFPFPTEAARVHAEQQFARIETGGLVLADGLAFGAVPDVARHHQGRLRIVALVHHPLAFETGLPEALAVRLLREESEALAAADHVVVTSAATARALAGLGVGPERVSVVVPGTDRVEWVHEKTVPPRKLLCVGSIVPRKGHAVLIDALARLREFDWTLLCIGSLDRSPDTVARLRRQIAESGLDRRVALAGEGDEAALHRAYTDADCFVLPTLYEGYGMVVGEALAAGLPVIASRTGAIDELVDESCGVVVPPGDVEALTVALRRILTDAQFARTVMAGAARQRHRVPSHCGNQLTMPRARRNS
jgi:glycosyltransferase involved in cell wall biosynthesis